MSSACFGDAERCVAWAIVARVGDEDVTADVHTHAERVIELPVPAAKAAPCREEGAAVVELLDATIQVVADKYLPAAVRGHAPGVIELPAPAAKAAPCR